MSGVEDRLVKVEAGLGTLTGNVSTMCAARKRDKESAREEAKERHAELKTLIGENNDELRKINGTMNDHEKRLFGMELVDADRVRASATGDFGSPVSRRIPTPKQVAQGLGAAGFGSGLLWLLVKLTELQDVLAQLANSP